MKSKNLNFLLILSSLMVYLEWGQGQSSFLAQAEVEVFRKLFSDPLGVLHPLTLFPLLGQILLIITLFQSSPSKLLGIIGLGLLSILVLMVSLIGIASLNLKIFISTLPFEIIGFILIKTYRTK